MEIKTTKEINHEWSDYDKLMAMCQLNDCGKIYLDEYGCPIDDEYEIVELRKQEKINKYNED